MNRIVHFQIIFLASSAQTIAIVLNGLNNNHCFPQRLIKVVTLTTCLPFVRLHKNNNKRKGCTCNRPIGVRPTSLHPNNNHSSLIIYIVLPVERCSLLVIETSSCYHSARISLLLQHYKVSIHFNLVIAILVNV